jgi:hypothetical protein
MARKPENLKSIEWNPVEVVHANALDRSSLNLAFQEIGIAYYHIHSMGGHKEFQAKDIHAVQNFYETALINNV